MSFENHNFLMNKINVKKCNYDKNNLDFMKNFHVMQYLL